ncbi:MAG TPA: GNAT family N-acetyltransferase [Gemmatimonadaceae bacterium]
MDTVEVTRTYLEMTDPGQLRATTEAESQFRLQRVADCPAAFARFLYTEVGQRYSWTDRAGWSDEQWRARLTEPGVSLWVLYGSGAPAGYCELRASADGSTEIAYLGLLPHFVGRGLGKLLLVSAVRRAWSDGASRVWLHTCSLDSPAALPNYLARGFRKFREERVG